MPQQIVKNSIWGTTADLPPAQAMHDGTSHVCVASMGVEHVAPDHKINWWRFELEGPCTQEQMQQLAQLYLPALPCEHGNNADCQCWHTQPPRVVAMGLLQPEHLTTALVEQTSTRDI